MYFFHKSVNTFSIVLIAHSSKYVKGISTETSHKHDKECRRNDTETYSVECEMLSTKRNEVSNISGFTYAFGASVLAASPAGMARTPLPAMALIKLNVAAPTL